MNDFVGWMFAQFWYWTVFTFRLFIGLGRWLIWLVSSIQNIRNLKPPKDESDLFNQDEKGKR